MRRGGNNSNKCKKEQFIMSFELCRPVRDASRGFFPQLSQVKALGAADGEEPVYKN